MKTADQTKVEIDAMYANIKDLIENLECRWIDEHEYEDINDYAEVIRKALPVGFDLIRMVKRPFGFKFTVNDTPPHWQFEVFCTATKIGWRSCK